MSLFQTSVVKKYLNDLSSELIDKKYSEFQAYFGNVERQENIRNSKEEEYQSGFINALFVNILGYTLNPEPNFNIVLEKKNVDDSKKADGAILKENEVIAVIELKSTQTTDLGKVETQAFGYKNHNPKCQYIITSNFEKIRIYIQNAIDHLEFDLFNLSREDFALLWLCFAKDNVLQDIPLKIKESSVLQEENVTKQLYKDYSKFRKEIFENIVKNNPEFDKLVLFKKTQKLLDRFLFIFFAEDRLLLPPNSISEIVKQWTTLKEDLDEYIPLYERFKKYFGYLNTGFKGKKYDIFAYNGGLFLPDDILDNIKIDDEVLHYNTVQLSTYDFETDVDVNILGHIFEHSLSEIENVQAEIAGEVVDQQKTKRKKDGIFYTPKYITKYIVENTVGKLCEEKRNEFGIIDEEYAKGRKNRKKDIVRALDDKLTAYRDWLIEITILDPACGSGAFLNQALEFLIQEHKKIDELKFQLLGGSIVFPDIEAKILEKNIFGVDLNEESVEIAKLSLWLRTAQKGRKLTTLSNHIKCGNSLIDDYEIAGEKAFNWQNEFPEVFAKGGFDVVIGNPPYVRHEVIKEYKPAFQKVFETYLSTADLYVYFIELGIKVLKPKGVLGFINPNKFIKASYGKNLKSFLSRFQIEQLIDFGELNVFQDAVTSPLILLVTNSDLKKNAKYLQIKTLENLDINASVANETIVLNPKIFKQEKWNLISEKELSILDKVSNSGVSISDDRELDIKYGLKTGLNEAFIISQEIKDAIIKEHPKSADLIKEFIDGDDVRKYEIRSKNKHLICIPSGFTDSQNNFSTEDDAWLWMKENYVGVANYLEQFEDKAKRRSDKGKYWWELRACDYYNLIDAPKIIYPEIAMSSRFAIDSNSIYINKTIFLINSSSYSLLSLLNSKLIWFYLMNTCASLGDPKNGGRLNMQRIYLETISIPKDSNLNNPYLEQLAKKTQSFYTSLSKKKNRIIKRIIGSFEIDKLSNKLQAFYDYDFKTFIAELKKKKIKLSLVEQDEWEEYLESYTKEINELQSQIIATDKEIDQMVYELYGLSEEEIKIVEETN